LSVFGQLALQATHLHGHGAIGTASNHASDLFQAHSAALAGKPDRHRSGWVATLATQFQPWQSEFLLRL
jgi:hypothetical protein